MHRLPMQGIKDHEESGRDDTSDAKEMEIYELSDKEFRIILLKFSELQEHTGN